MTDLYSALKECWDSEKREWKPGWQICRVFSPRSKSFPTRPDAEFAAGLFVDGSEWEVIPPPLAKDEFFAPFDVVCQLVMHAGVLQYRERGKSTWTPMLERRLRELAKKDPDPNGWPRALAYFDKHAPPPKVTLRDAMVALLKGEARFAQTEALQIARTQQGIELLPRCCHWGLDRKLNAYRVLAGIDPDDGPAEWELVR